MLDVLGLVVEFFAWAWPRRRRSPPDAGRWERMSDQEQLATQRRRLRQLTYGLVVLVLVAAALTVASTVTWQRHQVASAFALALGVAGVVAGTAGAVSVVVAARSRQWPVVDPAAALEALQADLRVRRAADLAVAATVCVAVGVPLVWVVHGLPAG